MSIVSISTNSTGQIGVQPRRVAIISSDDLATVTTAGYLNPVNLQGYTIESTDEISMWYDYESAGSPGTFAIFIVSINSTTKVITLVLWEHPGVTLPVADGAFAVFAGIGGELVDVGYFPSDADKGIVAMVGSDDVVLNSLAHFTDTTGTIDDTAAAVFNSGDIYAGLDAVSGALRSYPATTATGYLGLTAIANSGAFNVQIRNAAHGQSTVYSIPDIGAATGGLVASTTQLKMKSVAGAAAAGGAAAQSFTDAFCSSGSMVVGNWNTQANAASVLKIVPGNGSFVVTSSADAGVGTFNYIITK